VNIFDGALYVYIRMISFGFLGSLLYVLLKRCWSFVFGGHLGISEVTMWPSGEKVDVVELMKRGWSRRHDIFA
jgi:hypothetical protein